MAYFFLGTVPHKWSPSFSPPKDSPLMRCSPLDAINNEIDVKQLIREAQPLCNEKIMSFREVKHFILLLLKPIQS
jgi:hypothetical protein